MNTYSPSFGKSLVNIEQDNGVLERTTLQRRVNTSSSSHFEVKRELKGSKENKIEKNKDGETANKYRRTRGSLAASGEGEGYLR